tara:strand:+ start:165 stop:527 length:363 start_codon:yes stop_codon:yes gene_type:complete
MDGGILRVPWFRNPDPLRFSLLLPVQLYTRNLFIGLILVSTGFLFGLFASIPVNYIIDAEAANVLWYGGGVSGPDRFGDHRSRVYFTAMFFAYVFLHLGHVSDLLAKRNVEANGQAHVDG